MFFDRPRRAPDLAAGVCAAFGTVPKMSGNLCKVTGCSNTGVHVVCAVQAKPFAPFSVTFDVRFWAHHVRERTRGLARLRSQPVMIYTEIYSQS